MGHILLESATIFMLQVFCATRLVLAACGNSFEFRSKLIGRVSLTQRQFFSQSVDSAFLASRADVSEIVSEIVASIWSVEACDEVETCDGVETCDALDGDMVVCADVNSSARQELAPQFWPLCQRRETARFRIFF